MPEDDKKVTLRLPDKGRGLPGVPGGAWLWPPVGILTIRDSTAALLPAHGSSAIGLGRDFLRLFLGIFSSVQEGEYFV